MSPGFSVFLFFFHFIWKKWLQFELCNQPSKRSWSKQSHFFFHLIKSFARKAKMTHYDLLFMRFFYILVLTFTLQPCCCFGLVWLLLFFLFGGLVLLIHGGIFIHIFIEDFLSLFFVSLLHFLLAVCFPLSPSVYFFLLGFPLAPPPPAFTSTCSAPAILRLLFRFSRMFCCVELFFIILYIPALFHPPCSFYTCFCAK